MNMRVIRIDRIDGTKTGFAKYCPTFARLPIWLEARRELHTMKKIVCSDGESREKLLAAFEKSPEKTVRSLGRLLFDKSPYISQLAAMDIWYAAIKKYNLKEVVPALAASMAHENEKTREYVYRALTTYYLKKGSVHALGTLLFLTNQKDQGFIRKGMNDAVESIGKKETGEIITIVTVIDAVLKSKEFILEMGENSPTYISLVTVCAEVMEIIEKRTRKEKLELTSFSPPSRS